MKVEEVRAESYSLDIPIPHWIDPESSPSRKLDCCIHSILFEADACLYAIAELADTLEGKRPGRHMGEHIAAIRGLGRIGSALVQSTWPLIDQLEEFIKADYDLIIPETEVA